MRREHRPLTVEIVDGDARVRRQVERLLRRVGYRTHGYSQAEELLNAIDSDGMEAACVISELELPGMDGLSLLQDLRKRDLDVPVIILTADANVGTAVVAMRSRVADYLTKPFVERDLLRRLKAALVRHGTEVN